MVESDRTAVRHRAYKKAKVVLHDMSTIDCTLRDLSDSGARLEFSDPVVLPDRFDVLMVSTRMLVPAERAWKRGTAIGVRFTGPGRPISHTA